MTERSYNGWVASKDPHGIGIAPFAPTGHPFPPGVRAGDVAIVLGYVVTQYAKRVEPLGEGCWGYAYRKNRNANNLSCHASGTAVDVNAPKHPNGKHGTHSAAQVATIHQILAEVDHVIRWGGDYQGTVDAMHFEVNCTPVALHAVAVKLTKAKNKPPAAKPPTAHASWWTHDLHRGDHGHDVLVARHNLGLGTASDVYDDKLTAKVNELQHQHGRPPNGAVIDAATSLLIGG